MVDLTSVDILAYIPDAKHKSGVEYSAPCFACGGTDRLTIWKVHDSTGKGRYWCRQCQCQGDVVDLLRERDGLSMTEALERLGIQSSANGAAVGASGKAKLLDIPDGDLPGWQVALMRRGIVPETIIRYGITERIIHGVSYWAYPVRGTDSSTITRCKRIDSSASGPKYFTDYKSHGFTQWPRDVIYQSNGLLQNSIQLAKGVLWLSFGELNTWLLHSVLCPAHSETVNATTWLTGEAAIPETLVKDLQRWKVSTIKTAPDCDAAGIACAVKLRDALKNSGITLEMKQLPGAPNSKYDLEDYILSLLAAGPLTGETFIKAFDALPNFQFPDTKRELFVSLSSQRGLIVEQATNDETLNGWPLTLPFAGLARLRGMARVLMPRKMLGVVAPSAGGKTTLIETIVDHWLQRGYSGVMYGPEWTPREYFIRRLVRYGAIENTDILDLYELWKVEERDGIATGSRAGRNLLESEKTSIIQGALAISRWPGKLDLLDDSTIPLEDMLSELTLQFTAQRAAGRKYCFAVFDYAQLIETSARFASDVQHAKYVVSKLKSWGIANDAQVILGSQTTKTASASAKEGRAVGSDDMYVLRDWAFNLLVTLKMDYVEDDETGEYTMLSTGLLRVTKNSAGSTGTVPIMANWPRLLIADRAR